MLSLLECLYTDREIKRAEKLVLKRW